MKKCLFVFLLLVSTYGVSQYIVPESFDIAMVSAPEDAIVYNHFLSNTPHKRLLKLIKQKYNQFGQLIAQGVSEQLRIPKIIHQIWIGPCPVPEKTLAWQQSWRDLHPDWEYKLWTNEDVDQLEFENKKYFDEAKNWGEKADILRYEILCRFGGVYVDIDFEAIKSLDWLHYSCDFYVGIHAIPLLFSDKLRINNGLIAAIPQHPILQYAVEQIPYFRGEKGGVAKRTGPDFFTNVIATIFSIPSNAMVDVVFPSNFFYPSGPREGIGFTIKPGEAYIQPETLAVHYYTAYWLRPNQKKGGLEKKRRLYSRPRRYAGRESMHFKKKRYEG